MLSEETSDYNRFCLRLKTICKGDEKYQNFISISSDHIDKTINDGMKNELPEENLMQDYENYGKYENKHFNYELEEETKEKIKNKTQFKRSTQNKENVQMIIKDHNSSINVDWNQFYSKLSFSKTRTEFCKSSFEDADIKQKIFLTSVGHALSMRKDLFIANKSMKNMNNLQKLLSVFLTDHIYRSKKRVESNNAKILENPDADDDDFCDQGFTKTRVLILLPTRASCYSYIESLIRLMKHADNNVKVEKWTKFEEEYGETDEDADSDVFRSYPLDHQQRFRGNTDDNFRIGVQIENKTSLKLYSSFKNSDIIMASPLGLKTLFASDDDAKAKNETLNEDCLSSIEILLIDDITMMLMQNFEHLIDSIGMLNEIPKNTGNTDFSRLYKWASDGNFSYYRQTILVGEFECPETLGILNNICHNYEGSVIIRDSDQYGKMSMIKTPISMIFHKFESKSYRTDHEDRFDSFVSQIFQNYKKDVNGVAIFVSSYVDYVKLRNYMKLEHINFIPISEYTEHPLISRFKAKFYGKEYNILLFTERYYFYYRHNIKGINHLIFYQLPKNPVLFPYIVNLVKIENADETTAIERQLKSGKKRTDVKDYSCRILHSCYDHHSLASCLGSGMAEGLLESSSDQHIIYPDLC